MANLSWTTTVQMSGGPTIRVSREPKAVEAYDYVTVDLEHGKEITVDLQPSDVSEIRMVLVKSNYYGDKVTLTVVNDTEPASFPLDEPQMFAGSAVRLLGDLKVLKLKLEENDDVETATVEIFVFRDAIRPPPPAEGSNE